MLGTLWNWLVDFGMAIYGLGMILSAVILTAVLFYAFAQKLIAKLLPAKK